MADVKGVMKSSLAKLIAKASLAHVIMTHRQPQLAVPERCKTVPHEENAPQNDKAQNDKAQNDQALSTPESAPVSSSHGFSTNLLREHGWFVPPQVACARSD